MPQVHFRTPAREEMHLRQGWLNDPQVMAYNAHWDVSYPGYRRDTGCIDFPPEQWDAWYDAWIDRPDRSYWFVENEPGELVAHAHYAISRDGQGRRVASIGATVFPEFRRAGVGRAVFSELVKRIRARNDVDVIQNSFEANRTEAVSIHEKLGFKLVGMDSTLDSQRPVGIYELQLN